MTQDEIMELENAMLQRRRSYRQVLPREVLMRDTIDMAREAGKLKCDCCLPYYEETDIEGFEGFLKAFEALVRADEREACAKVCEETDDGTPYNLAEMCARNIRARGQA
jgi:hypothetical protein